MGIMEFPGGWKSISLSEAYVCTAIRISFEQPEGEQHLSSNMPSFVEQKVEKLNMQSSIKVTC